MEWNAKQYLKFEQERNISIFDLIHRIQTYFKIDSLKDILDLGCGPGNSTKILSSYFKDSSIIGIDNSIDMLNNANNLNINNARFEYCDMQEGLLDLKFDLIFANASLQWIENQEKLFLNVFNNLNDNGIFAVQMPLNEISIFHQKLKELALKYNLNTRIFHSLSHNDYYDLLSKYSSDFIIWDSTYYHILDDLDSVIEWYRGSGLRVYLSQLNKSLHIEFVDKLKNLISPHFAKQIDSKIILPMHRIFFVAKKLKYSKL